MTEPISLGFVLQVVFNYLPAVILFAGLTALISGCLPSLSFLNWVYLILTFITVYLGPMMSLPDWVTKLSPFGIIPHYPVDNFSPGVWVGMTAVTLVLGTVGLLAYRRRDLQG